MTYRCKECGTRYEMGINVDEGSPPIELDQHEPVKCNECHLNYTL